MSASKISKRKRPVESEDSDDEDLGPRPVLPAMNSVSALVQMLQSAKNIVAVVGAGISVSCG